MSREIQFKLERYCLINRKYQLNNKNHYLNTFSFLEKADLEKAWALSYEKIQNHEIIKDVKDLPIEYEYEILNRLKDFNFNRHELYFYLFRKFDVKSLKLRDEQIERRIRNILALRHQNIIINEIEKTIKDDKIYSIRRKIASIAGYLFFSALVIAIFFGSIIRDGFTPVDVLTEKIYKKEIYLFDGSICRDGSISRSQGRGTCSWHKGVRKKFFKGEPKYTKKECRVMAIKRSWVD